MKVLIIGCGYVGLTTGVCLAYIGHDVTFLDTDKEKIDKLQKGDVPFYEPGLAEMIYSVRNNIEYRFYLEDITPDKEIIMITVGTPTRLNGEADISMVELVAKNLGGWIPFDSEAVIVNKSTVPIGTASRVKHVIEQYMKRRGIIKEVHVVSNPEFLKEGKALTDSFYPDRIVVGAGSTVASEILYKLYEPLIVQSFSQPPEVDCPKGYTSPAFIKTSPINAEMIKYAANSFLAMKISFINEFANLAEQVGADITEVARGIGLDKRVGTEFLKAGVGWGGSCFGKDTRSILHIGRQYDCDMKLVEAAIQVNYKQRNAVIKKLKSFLKILRGRTIGILGLTFKPDTDDLRDAPALDIIRTLNQMGAHVKVYDPVAMESCQKQFPDLQMETCPSADELFEGCHAVVLVTEWGEFLKLPYFELGKKMFSKILIDGRNVLSEKQLINAGFLYTGLGRCSMQWEKEYLSPEEQVL